MFVDQSFFGKGSNKKRILVVDDEEAVVSFIEGALLLEGKYEVAAATDGFDAGQQVVTFEPDLIILDIMLPGMDGFEVCRRVKTDVATQHIKVLAITGFASDENIEKILRMGADDYLAKPLKLQELHQKLEELLGDREQDRGKRAGAQQ
jgi:CheY-like chemotaxis protein